jgi:N-acylneuraminate cytidylyltransferase/CMP-N,N'-diacetyllegionaminic acid synthase
MHEGRKIIALIPARGGSKGIPQKNIRDFCGKPLIAWTIEAAKASRYVDLIIVSTDDEKIASVSKEYGAKVPFIRPADLATDTAAGMDAILHSLNFLKEKGNSDNDILVLLQPTSPLRKAKDIDDAVEYCFSRNADAVVSVCKEEHGPRLMGKLQPDMCMKDFITVEDARKNRQDHDKYYRINGAVYIASFGYLKKNKSFFGSGSYAFLMPNERSIDIDSWFDFNVAEFLKERDKEGRS